MAWEPSINGSHSTFSIGEVQILSDLWKAWQAIWAVHVERGWANVEVHCGVCGRSSSMQLTNKKIKWKNILRLCHSCRVKNGLPQLLVFQIYSYFGGRPLLEQPHGLSKVTRSWSSSNAGHSSRWRCSHVSVAHVVVVIIRHRVASVNWKQIVQVMIGAVHICYSSMTYNL